MSRRFGWAMLVAAGMVLGGALGFHERIHAAPARETSAEDQDMEIADQLRELRTQVKEINKLLHTGTLRVVLVISPEAQR